VRTLVEASIQTLPILRYLPIIIFLVECINVLHKLLAVTQLSFIGNVSASNPGASWREWSDATLDIFTTDIEKLHGVLYATSSYI